MCIVQEWLLQDIRSQVALTLLILATRFVLIRCCYTPLARWLNICDPKRKTVLQNVILEVAYNKSRQCKDPASLAKKVDMTERQVERWWRLRRSQDKPSTLVKFCENMWLGTFHLFNLSFGMYILCDRDWLWDKNKLIEEIYLEIPGNIWWYCMVTCAFYWSRTVGQFWEVRRKDFWQMFLHHIVTITLIDLSRPANCYRICAVTIFLHEWSDVVLEFSKAAKYARIVSPTLTLPIFGVSWVVTRLILFPYCILTNTTTVSLSFGLERPLYVIVNAMFWLLLGMHLVWTWMILQMAHTAATSDKELEDIRSSESDGEHTHSGFLSNLII